MFKKKPTEEDDKVKKIDKVLEQYFPEQAKDSVFKLKYMLSHAEIIEIILGRKIIGKK